MSPWHPKLDAWRDILEDTLDRGLPPESDPPEKLHAAMRYSVLGGGKRLRPLLCMAAAEAVGGDPGQVVWLAGALELVHAYSLVHDDLPAMDDDALRRGRPTCHVAFGEALAILAGDALLTLAFQWATRPLAAGPRATVKVLDELARAAGHDGMVAGQVYDLEAEGQDIDRSGLERIHRHKTGALIRAALRLGALGSGADDAALAAVTAFGEPIGLAFQVVDDLLNVSATEMELGKPVGSDAARAKATYPALLGIPASRVLARDLQLQALAAVEHLPGDLAPLNTLAHAAVERSR